MSVFSGDVAEWFGSLTNDIEGPHVVELSNAYGEQIFHFTCYISQEKDHCRFSEKAWNQFVDEIGLTVGDILVLLKSNTLWKLSYTVFVLPDALMVPQNNPRTISMVFVLGNGVFANVTVAATTIVAKSSCIGSGSHATHQSPVDAPTSSVVFRKDLPSLCYVQRGVFEEHQNSAKDTRRASVGRS